MNKKLLVLLGIYASWVITTLLYNKKNPSEINKEIEMARKSWEKDIKVLFNNFIEIHQNLLESLKTKLLTDENKKYFNEKKDEFLVLVENYKIKAEKIFEEYKVLGKDYAEEWLVKLEKFYKEKLEELDNLKEKAPEKVEEVKKKLLTHFEEVKKKMKK